MKLLIIGNTNGTPTGRDREYYQSYIDFFTASAKTVDETTIVRACLFDDLIISAGDGDFTIFDTLNGSDISEYDVFFLRGDKFRRYMDAVVTVNQYANKHGIKTINDYSNARDSSKLLQAVQFELHYIPVARTWLVTGALLSNMPEDFTYPCIMKATDGSHGDHNHLVKSLDEIRAVVESTPERRFVLQRFVPNDGDFRILIIDEEVMIIRRSAQGDSHLNNTSKGGDAAIVDTESLPREVIENAKKIAKHLHMTIAGVDVLMDKTTGEYYFLEVNAQPQLMTGAVVPEKMAMIGRFLDKLNNAR